MEASLPTTLRMHTGNRLAQQLSLVRSTLPTDNDNRPVRCVSVVLPAISGAPGLGG